MDVVGSEIGQKMRSAIKAKLTELGCYVDDELPDYVMVMVANKRTREQMEDDLQLFLGDNTELFVNWLHQVLKKLQEVTIAAPKPSEPEKCKEKERSHSKDKKPKEKKSKDKTKKSDLKKSKKKDKEKERSLRKKEQKKAHKKKKSKDKEMIRPNIPPLLMNMEKDSEPSITDAFAGQILKNHGILMESIKEDPKETKPALEPEPKRPIQPIIDPATILTRPSDITDITNKELSTSDSSAVPREEQIKEMNEIEAKIQGLRQKLAEQLDSMSEDEDFLNIRTEAEELMNDFVEDVFMEITEPTPAATPPAAKDKCLTPPKSPAKPLEPQKDPEETLPQIELKLPKRPVRERLGAREEVKKVSEAKSKENRRGSKSPESFTPERELEPPKKSAKSRLDPPEPKRKLASETHSEKTETSSKRLTSRVSVLENRRGRSSCASVVRVRPRLRVPAPASSLLLRAVADAHKSLLNIPPKVNKDPQTVKRALVLPMRRLDAKKIVISVPGDRPDDVDANDAISLGEPESDDDKSSKRASDTEKDDFVPKQKSKKNQSEYNSGGLTMKVHNTEYLSSRRFEGRTATRKDDNIVIETINIHNPSVGKDKNTQFIVTMDGFNPNSFLAKKLQTEGLLNDDEELQTNKGKKSTPDLNKAKDVKQKDVKQKDVKTVTEIETVKVKSENTETSVETKTDIQTVIDPNDNLKVEETFETIESKSNIDKADVDIQREDKIDSQVDCATESQDCPPVKKRKSSPIVFNVSKAEKEKESIRERTESASSDNHVTVTTTTSSHKYDTLPPLAITTEKKPVWCRAFPQCRYGATCAFLHPRCKFAASCTRRNCPYSHSHNIAPTSPLPVIASHVVPAANYKTISTAPPPAMCKYYPNCANPACHFYHPKPCRFGKLCTNKLECNFYHADSAKWRYPV